jgi:CheY-like chemotaxis protein
VGDPGLERSFDVQITPRDHADHVADPQPGAETNASRHVLVIDDSRLMLAAARVGLARISGWQVTTATSGQEGIALAAAARPDAILLDVEMPGLDGPGTLQALGEQEATRDVPVVFLTAAADSDRVRLTALGAAGLIAKPFEPMRLAERLSEVLGWDK